MVEKTVKKKISKKKTIKRKTAQRRMNEWEAYQKRRAGSLRRGRKKRREKQKTLDKLGMDWDYVTSQAKTLGGCLLVLSKLVNTDVNIYEDPVWEHVDKSYSELMMERETAVLGKYCDGEVLEKYSSKYNAVIDVWEEKERQQFLANRDKVTQIDKGMIESLKERLEICVEIGRYKNKVGLSVLDEKREKEIIQAHCNNGLYNRFVTLFFRTIFEESKRLQDLDGKPAKKKHAIEVANENIDEFLEELDREG